MRKNLESFELCKVFEKMRGLWLGILNKSSAQPGDVYYGSKLEAGAHTDRDELDSMKEFMKFARSL